MNVIENVNGIDIGPIEQKENNYKKMCFCENKYKYYEHRIKTFSVWPKAHPIKQHKLCAAGFVYTGYSDKVYCFCCNLILYKFNATDNPFIEHLKFSQHCEFLKIVLPNITNK